MFNSLVRTIFLWEKVLRLEEFYYFKNLLNRN